MPQPRDGNKRGGYTRQRRGCVTCRQRKKKCDQVYPICGHCSRLNLVCNRETPRPLKPSSSPSKDPSNTDTEDVSVICHCRSHKEIVRIAQLCIPLDLVSTVSGNVEPTNLVASRRSMLRYYTVTLAFLLTTNLENNCFLSVLMPMAFECQPLMYALAASASSHLALRSSEFKDVALRHRGLALSKLNTAMRDSELSPEMCLAVTMVLCSMESISDATDTWYHHLAGAAAALKTTPCGGRLDPEAEGVCLSSPEGKWLLRNFAYHDVLMSVSMDCRPFLVGDYWLSEDNSLADPYFGFASRVLFLISETSVLNADFVGAKQASMEEDGVIIPETAGGDGSEFARSSFSDRARLLESELRSWSCPSGDEGSPLTELGEAYRHAALIHLYRTIRRHVRGYSGVLEAKIQTCVKEICDLVGRMPEGCLAECTLVFPLFIAGGEARDTEHVETIRERLGMIVKLRRFRNVEACVDVLDEVWRLRASGSRSPDQDKVDWLDIVEHRGWKLAIT
ncbi:C6 transcription factor [Colletotrichum chrysophilum]|uniref:C6 transcription factor n=1 Tax=Colletotrichum chrysophilum TaxID=1836956 RepID=A0AAD9ELN5_9PEZI|nr:C6 transcription factor [Colletotrichum chrysophilum]